MKDKQELEKRNLFVSPRFLVPVSFILIHLLITLPLAYILNAWVDECSTLYNTNKGFLDTFQNVFYTEKQAPLYFWLLSLWRNIDGAIFFARLFSISCSCLAIKFFYDLVSSFFVEKKAILLTAFFAFHPYLIWASLEIRLYSMAVLLSVLMLDFFTKGYLNRRDAESQRKSQIAFLIFSIIGIYTNYYLGFLLVGGFLGLLLLKRWKAAQTYFLQMFIVGLAILPLVWFIKSQLATNTSGHQEINRLIDGIKLLWGHFLNFIFPTELLAPEEQTKISFFRVWLVRFGILAAILLLVKNKFGALDEKVLLFGTFSVIIAAFMLFAFSILGGEYISIRHAAVLFVPLILLIASLLANLLPEKSWIALAIIFTLLFPYSIYSLFPTLAKRGDWWRVSQFIEANEKPNQPIITSQVYDAIALPPHYKGKNQVLPNERFFEWNAEDSLKSENAFKKQTEFIISKIPPDAQEIWLLTRDSCQNPETAASCRPLENFVQEHYTIEIEKDFYLEKLRLLKKK
ncbi:MAG: hypothetical protein K1X72_11360 [Pyrinomonadaceae bacterium]|nr:hypothetical protein [Pyrinomonadaceae bacterium]